MWGGVIASFPRDRGLLIPDARGHGGSTLGWRSPTVDLWAEDVAALIEHAGIARPAVAGLSMGGYTAMALGALAPDLVRGWGFISTSAAHDDDDGRARRASALATVWSKGWREYFDGLAPSLLAAGRSDGTIHRWRLETMFVRAGDAGLASALFALAARPDRRSLLPSLRAPAAVVVGDADVLTPPDRAREIADAVPRAELTVLSGVGHMSAMESPEEVASALLRLDESIPS